MSDLPVAHPWFRADDAGEGITRLWEPYVDELLVSNVWHVPGRDADLVVDAGNGIGPLRPVLDALTEGRPLIAVATHGHFDHVGGLHELDDRRVHVDDAEMTRAPFPLRLRREDFAEGTEEMFAYYDVPVPHLAISAVPHADFDVGAWVTPGAVPTLLLHEGDVIDLGDRSFEVLHTPGHTAGSICLWGSATGTLFTGDAFYADAKLSWDDPAAATPSLERIASLPVGVAHAGHERSVGAEELRAIVHAELDRLRSATP